MRLLVLIICFFTPPMIMAQANTADSIIHVTGRVIDSTTKVNFYDLLVINKTLGKGIFGKYTGEFSIDVKKGDLLAVSVGGYKTRTFSFKDSAYKQTYDIQLYLETREVIGKTVVVRPIKTLEQLKEERESLVKREIPQITGVSAVQSPITALYMQFSKREKTKRKVAEMQYQDRQEDIVREILRLYVHHDIIDLSEEEFSAFITFLNINPALLISASDYELIVYIKEKFEHYRNIQEGF